MTNNNSDFLQNNGLSVSPVFLDFVETSVIPATSLSRTEFWQSFASLVSTANAGNQPCTTEPQMQTSDTTIPVRKWSKAENTTWGSLYDALYHDNVIPHTTGLKPGSNINMARHDRVVRCTRDFLDKTFPLSEGSHRDAVSYMAYFQNLLVILADGTTTGLKSPKQFVAKNGPSDSPDSILLEHNNTHTEILFDCNGKNGSKDLACIEDIQLETTQRTVFDLAASSAVEKCATYKNWISIVRCQRDKTFSNCDGEQHTINNCNWAITSSAPSEQCTLVMDQNDAPVADAVVDAIVSAVIESAYSQNTALIYLCFAEACPVMNDKFITELEHLIRSTKKNLSANCQEISVKVSSVSAVTRENSAAQKNNNTTSESVLRPVTATIDTMHSHGYDFTQAQSL